MSFENELKNYSWAESVELQVPIPVSNSKPSISSDSASPAEGPGTPAGD